MKLNYSTYKDKVYACWIGKNIGGTMGTPYEGRRQINDIAGSRKKHISVHTDSLEMRGEDTG